MPTLLLTRPEQQSKAVADMVRPAGWRSIIWPMTVIERLIDSPPDLTGAQALLLTSPRGAEVFCLAGAPETIRRDIPTLTVGPATTKAAYAAGFRTLIEAGGDGAALVTLAKEHLSPGKGRVIHVCGKDMAVDIASALTEAGFETVKIIAYRARVANQPDDIAPDLRDTLLDAAAFYSPRAARIFAEKMQCAPLELAGTTAIAISTRAAKPLASLGFAGITVAKAPNGSAMLNAIRSAAILHR